MNTLKENTTNFLNDVKSVLDKADWDFEACNPRGNYEDSEKACDYLSTQRFSLKLIKDALEEIWEDLVYELRTSDRSESNAEVAALFIDDQLAFSRISRFQASGWRVDGLNSKKWWIDETVSFKIIL